MISIARSTAQESRRVSKKNRAAVALGRRGGKATSERKAQSSRENGKKGGRPKKKDKAESQEDIGYRDLIADGGLPEARTARKTRSQHKREKVK
jgi:hypothetical protein